jgi:ribosomal-protein-alanine N-acetyltransferase
MNPLVTTLRRATPADAAVALAWSPTAEDLHHWAGANVRWPATPESFWEDLNVADATTFTLASPDHDVLGLGQVRHREQTYGHLARVIVSPHHRGLGLGRKFCTALMRIAPTLHPITTYSLYVYDDNTPAIGLYESLGFIRSGVNPHHPNVLLMLAPLSAISEKSSP